MFSIFWPNVTEIQNFSQLQPRGSKCFVVGAIGGQGESAFMRCGILANDGKIVFQLTPQSIFEEGMRIVSSDLAAFVSKGQLFQFQLDSYDAEAVLSRALGAANHASSTGVFSRFGDDFVHWCISGQTMGPDLDEFGYFGEHFGVPFQDEYAHVIKAMHHAIGIENGLVIHFEKDAVKKGVGWKKSLQYSTFEKFNENGRAIRFAYKDVAEGTRLAARNRAVNAFLSQDEEFGRYSLWQKNCEHFAVWCRTGQRNSKQIEAVLGSLAWAAVTGLTALSGRPNLYGLSKAIRTVGPKHFKFPWSKI